MTYEELAEYAQASGFTFWGQLDVSTISLKPEVRDMCAANSCGRYGKSWSCPPGCGTLEQCRQRLKDYTVGILVQTCGDVEDGFDFESMVEIEKAHKEHFYAMHRALSEAGKEALAIGAGSCTLCKECTYPNAPCRFPNKAVASMEAYGMLVVEICKANQMRYYYGSNKMAYTSCFLVK